MKYLLETLIHFSHKNFYHEITDVPAGRNKLTGKKKAIIVIAISLFVVWKTKCAHWSIVTAATRASLNI